MTTTYIRLTEALGVLQQLYLDDLADYGAEIPEGFDYQRAKEALMRCTMYKGEVVTDGGAPDVREDDH